MKKEKRNHNEQFLDSIKKRDEKIVVVCYGNFVIGNECKSNKMIFTKNKQWFGWAFDWKCLDCYNEEIGIEKEIKSKRKLKKG